MNEKYEFIAVIKKAPDMDSAYIEIPFDIKDVFGKGRLPVHATFDGEPYDGNIVNMGVKNPDGSVCYIIGIRKEVRAKIKKQPGDQIKVTIVGRDPAPLPYATIDDYIARYDGEVRARMEQLRELILSCSPDITEKISWAMPTFVLNGNLVHFAAAKHHIGLYPGASGVASFAGRLAEYKHSKGTIQFPNNKPMPYELIREIVMFRVQENKA